MMTASVSTHRCKICGVRLSLYNDDILCFSCQKKEVEQSFRQYDHKSLGTKKSCHAVQPKSNSNSREFLGLSGARVKISISSR